MRSGLPSLTASVTSTCGWNLLENNKSPPELQDPISEQDENSTSTPLKKKGPTSSSSLSFSPIKTFSLDARKVRAIEALTSSDDELIRITSVNDNCESNKTFVKKEPRIAWSEKTCKKAALDETIIIEKLTDFQNGIDADNKMRISCDSPSRDTGFGTGSMPSSMISMPSSMMGSQQGAMTVSTDAEPKISPIAEDLEESSSAFKPRPPRSRSRSKEPTLTKKKPQIKPKLMTKPEDVRKCEARKKKPGRWDDVMSQIERNKKQRPKIITDKNAVKSRLFETPKRFGGVDPKCPVHSMSRSSSRNSLNRVTMKRSDSVLSDISNNQQKKNEVSASCTTSTSTSIGVRKFHSVMRKGDARKTLSTQGKFRTLSLLRSNPVITNQDKPKFPVKINFEVNLPG